jgi:hypothetical protein
VLILRENIIVFGENLKLGINLRRTIVNDFYNKWIYSVFVPWIFPSSRKGFPHNFLCLVLVQYFRIPQVLEIRFYSQQVVSERGSSGSDEWRKRKDVRNREV